MLLTINLIKTYPLILTNLEKQGDITYVYLDINCPLKSTLSVEYNDVIDNQENWKQISNIKPIDIQANCCSEVVIGLDSDLEDGYYTFKLSANDFFTYCQPIKKDKDMFYDLKNDYIENNENINGIEDEKSNLDNKESFSINNSSDDDKNERHNFNRNFVKNGIESIFIYLNYFVGLLFFCF